MKVRATRTGYYDHLRRREGDVFVLKTVTGHYRDKKTGKLIPKVWQPEDQFSHNWMEKVEDNAPVRVTTAQQSLNKEQADIKAGRQGPSGATEEQVEDVI